MTSEDFMKGNGELYATPPIEGYPDLVALLKIQMGLADVFEVASEIKRISDSGVMLRMPTHHWLFDVKNQLEYNDILKNGEVNLFKNDCGSWELRN
jgi:hypothetical protein